MNEQLSYEQLLELKVEIQNRVNDIVALLRKAVVEAWNENWSNTTALISTAKNSTYALDEVVARVLNQLNLIKHSEEKKEKEKKEVKKSGVQRSNKPAKKDKKKAKE